MKGEEQKKLDVLSNDVFIKALKSSGRTVSDQLIFTVYWKVCFMAYGDDMMF